MPRRALLPCRKTGCPALLEKSGFCPKHEGDDRKAFDAHRPSSSERMGAGWPAIRAEHLRLEPNCRHRDLTCSGPMHVDHIKRRSEGGGDGHDNLRTLCEHHHNSRTAREQGFGRPRGVAFHAA